MSRQTFIAGLRAICGPQQHPPAAQQVFAKVRISHGVTAQELTGRERSPHIVAARRIAAREFRRMGMSLPWIGKVLGGRDHTTIINLLRERGQK